MAEATATSQELESTTVGIYRTSTVVRGGRRFSFGALVVVGDRSGRVGLGYGKAPGVPGAIEKAQKAARKELNIVPLEGKTIPHPIEAKFGASIVRLLPAAPGTGVIAGGTVRAVLELAGIQDCLTKAYGSTNKKNLCRAVMEWLLGLKSKKNVEALRGFELEQTEVEHRIEVGERYAPAVQQNPGAAAKAPKNKKDQAQKEKQGRKGGKGKKKGGGGRGEAAPGASGDAAASPTPAESPAPETPAPQTPAPETPEAGGGAPAPEAGGGPEAAGGANDSKT